MHLVRRTSALKCLTLTRISLRGTTKPLKSTPILAKEEKKLMTFKAGFK